MSFDYSTLITDRTRSDSDTLKTLLGKPMAEWTAEERTAFNGAVMKGSYDYTDLNRVDACMEDLVARLNRVGCSVPGYERLKIPRKNAPSGQLPDGYTEVQYIQSSGTQCIDTGFKPTVNTKFSFGVYMLEQTGDCIIGNFLNDDNDYRIFNYSGAIYWDFKDSRIIGAAGSFPENTYFEFECGNNYVKKNGEQVLTGPNISAFTADANIFAFSKNGAPAGCSGKLYFLKIHDGETLIRDYVPCISPAGAVGLYDLVGDKFYGNSGTGAFFAGPRKVTLPDGYTQVEYIKSNEAQYIDSGVPGDSDVRVVSEFDLLANSKSTSCIFGAQGTDSMRYVLCSKSAGTFRSDYGTQITTGPAATVGGHYIADKNRNICKLNGDAITSPQATFSGNSNIYLFARSYSSLSPSKINLYLCRIYKADVLTRDYIPCTNASGAAGLYDLVEQEFYGNAGTGSFTAGPVVTWETAPEEPTETLDPYTWYESDVPVPSQMARYRANVAAVRAALRMPEETPGVPETMRRLTTAEANSIEMILLALNFILNQIPAAVRHCGVTVCGSKGVRA